MAGQHSHFVNYAQDPSPYARDRYFREYGRLLAVMDVRLRDREYLAGDYSIADIASFPWVMPYKRFGYDLDTFENLRGWFDRVKARPAVRRGVDVGKDLRQDLAGSHKARSIMFGQDAKTVMNAAKATEK